MSDDPRSTIFISYSDATSATELDHILDRAFEGRLRIFNTSTSRSGLSAGDQIDPALLAQVQRSAVFISLWTPGAVRRPAWMAWELGAATASGVPVAVARALGVRPDELPLNLSARHAPDLGAPDELLAFIRTVAGLLGGVPYSEGVTRAEFERHTPAPSPLRAKIASPTRIRFTLHGRRALLENETDALLDDVSIISADEGLASLETSIDEQFLGRDRRIGPHERLVVPVEAQAMAGGKLRFEWIADDTGRQQQDIVVRPVDGR